jgi:mRNA-degrading endonuclease toxin of MazEF toxin-antitoxin module
VVGIGHAALTPGPRRGDIHLVQFEDVGGHVMRGPHPALVVSSDRLNRGDGTVLVCSLTSRSGRPVLDWTPPYLVRVTGRESGLDRDGWVKCDQVFTRPATWLGPRLGRLAPDAMSRVDASLRFVLALP